MPQEPLASDDTQGAINHCWRRHVGMNVLFADGHTEFREANELDPEHAVGQKDGLLSRLRN